MPAKSANYFCITTPQGTGGIGITELFGPDALKITSRIFRPTEKKGQIKPNRIYLGHIYNNQELIEEVIIHFTPGKKSFTGLDSVEINAHGGIMPCRLIGQLLKKYGAKELAQPKVIGLAKKNGRLDRIQAEALGYLLQAQTPLAASVLLDQYNGALSKALKSKKNLNTLRASARFGIALTQPKRILILGRPNVGKSTLFNALLGQDRAITHHMPGTTRDTIEDMLDIKGFPFVLVDTAGLNRSSRDPIEKAGMAYARKEIPKADVIVLVLEKEEIASPGALRHPRNDKNNSCHYEHKRNNLILADALMKKTKAPVITVMNKIDKLSMIQDTGHKTQDNIIPVSALKRAGLDELRQEILRACGLDGFKYRPGAPIIFSKNILCH